MADAAIVEPGAKENRNSGLCACGCGAILAGSGRGRPQRWAADACRKRAELAARRLQASIGKRMLALGAMPINQRRQLFVRVAMDLRQRGLL